MRGILSYLTLWFNHIRTAPDIIISQWFDILDSALKKAQKEGAIIHAGWYPSTNGMQLLRIPEKKDIQTDAPPLYEVSILSLPPTQKYNSTYHVEISTTIMHTPQAIDVPSDIYAKKIDISITNEQIKEESKRLSFEQRYFLQDPEKKEHSLVDEKGNPLSFFSFSLIKPVVDEALDAGGYTTQTDKNSPLTSIQKTPYAG